MQNSKNGFIPMEVRHDLSNENLRLSDEEKAYMNKKCTEEIQIQNLRLQVSVMRPGNAIKMIRSLRRVMSLSSMEEQGKVNEHCNGIGLRLASSFHAYLCYLTLTRTGQDTVGFSEDVANIHEVLLVVNKGFVSFKYVLKFNTAGPLVGLARIK
ncbi:hypothetical protein Tco_0312048, partial [Tanacetum coccineum]